MLDHISYHKKHEKKIPWRKKPFWCKENGCWKMGFTKNGCVMKMLKTQRSKEILMEIDEGRWRSLEKCFLWEQMMRWRRKIKGKKKVNNANGGRKVDGRWSKKGKERDKEVGCQNFDPHTLKLSQSWVNSVKLSCFSQPKKKIFFKVKVFKYLLKSKFSTQNFHSQIFNFPFSMPKF